MKKQNKRKGFSAIEMLVVIAVIALLVSVVVPVIGNQSVKAKAAANAANLRTIESVVAMKLVEEPDAFEEYFKKGEASNKVDNFVEKGWPQKVVDYFLGEGAAESMIKDYYLQFSDGRTGKTLTIEGTSPQIIISGVALPVAMEAPRRDGGTGLVIGEYDYMSVYICQDGVLAFYNNFTKDDFADVAEDGYYDGAGSAGGVENSGGILGEIQKDVCQAQGRHEPGPGCKCRNCGAEAHVDADETKNLLGLSEYNSSTTLHECKCGKVFNAGHVYEGTDHKCKYKKTADEECPEVSPCVDLDPEDDGILGSGIFGDKEDHICYLCGVRNPYGTWCKDEKGGGYWSGLTWVNLPDHKCDLGDCNVRLTNCGDKKYTTVDALQHECNICKVKTGHTYNSGNTCECGYSKPTCDFGGCPSTDIVETDGDKGYCQTHKLKDCDGRVPALGIDIFNDTYDCDGKYRGTIDDCSNASNHVKCGVCKTANVEKNGYCSAHQEKTCQEPVLKDGGGTKKCNTKYRDTCGNAAYHHTTHTYVEVPTDAVKHKCACGTTEDHNYVNGVCTVCSRSNHKVGTDCKDSSPKDHNCDICGAGDMGTHSTTTDLKNGTHGCSYCGYYVSCTDPNKDHKCDTCGYVMSSCTDDDKDHNCDYSCGSTTVGGAHTTTTNLNNGYHGCSYCDKDKVKCTAGNKSHNCICGYRVTECADNNKDHMCDTCDKRTSYCNHSGLLKTGECDVCKKTNNWLNCPNC